MEQFTYFIPTRILFGAGQLNTLSQQKLPGKKALIVSSAGGSARKNCYLQRLEEQLDKAGVAHLAFEKILPNPIKEHVMEGAKLAKENGVDFVIGLGGGSSIDAAKAIAIMATNPGDYWDYLSGGSAKGQPLQAKPLPIVAITTTAGTGTEADPWTVTSKPETNEKIGFGCDDTFPTLSIVDPELMVSVPPHLTAYQGFDALFHSTEGYLNNTHYVLSDLYAIKAIELVGKSLAIAVKNGNDLNARANVALANTLAGMVESTSGCISEHSLAHALSALKPEIAHGAALIMICEAYYTFWANSGLCDARMVEMARALGKVDANKPMDFVAALSELKKVCGVEELKLSNFGIAFTDLPNYLANARDTMGGLFSVDPRPMTDMEVLKVLEDSYR